MRFWFGKRSSCQIAKDRLKILLISDRVNCSEEMLQMIKADITKVISKYMKIDSKHMDVQISTAKGMDKGSQTSFLYANIPILDIHKQTN